MHKDLKHENFFSLFLMKILLLNLQTKHKIHSCSQCRFSGYGDSFKFKVLGQIHLSQPEWNESLRIGHCTS
ncbi:hypothetical protein Bca4012_044481 [Brassica carinata]